MTNYTSEKLTTPPHSPTDTQIHRHPPPAPTRVPSQALPVSAPTHYLSASRPGTRAGWSRAEPAAPRRRPGPRETPGLASPGRVSARSPPSRPAATAQSRRPRAQDERTGSRGLPARASPAAPCSPPSPSRFHRSPRLAGPSRSSATPRAKFCPRRGSSKAAPVPRLQTGAGTWGRTRSQTRTDPATHVRGTRGPGKVARSRLSPWLGRPGAGPGRSELPTLPLSRLATPGPHGCARGGARRIGCRHLRRGVGDDARRGVPGAPGPDPHGRGGGVRPAWWSPASSLCHFPFLQPFLGKLFTSENFLPPFFLPAPSAFSSRHSLARKGSGCGAPRCPVSAGKGDGPEMGSGGSEPPRSSRGQLLWALAFPIRPASRRAGGD